MEEALYHQNYGYYATNSSRIGCEGDFFTSVSVGKVFGHILAERVLNVWEKLGRPKDFTITEMGANNGDLARDILLYLAKTPLHEHLQYHIIEPLPLLKKLQSEKLTQANIENFTIYSSIHKKPKTSGIFLCNELFDALPVERIQFNNGTWNQIRIKSDNATFHETLEPITSKHSLHSFCSKLTNDFPEGYHTEVCTNSAELIDQIYQSLNDALVILIDYGFPRSTYYERSRSEGTLQTYSKHTKNASPLLSPGEQDITAHVDFTAIAHSALTSGFNIHDFTSQARYLTHHGIELMKQFEGAPDPSFISQFQTLTHPGQMGHAFHVLELVKNIDLGIPLTHSPKEILEVDY